MPATVPVPTKNPGDVLTSALWNTYVAGNLNKLLNQGHRVLTVAQFAALGTPEDGDEVYLEVDATNGVMWHLRYVTTEPTNKWRFLGGPSLIATGTTGISATSYGDLGPSITLGRAGDYRCTWAANTNGSADSSAIQGFVGLSVGGAAPTDAESVMVNGAIARAGGGAMSKTKAVAAAGVVKVQGKGSGAGTISVPSSVLEVYPVRLI